MKLQSYYLVKYSKFIIFVSMKTYIYTLADPKTKEIRYVGKTTNLKRRAYQHFNVKISKKLGNKHLGNWLLFILNSGNLPIMEVLEECESNWVESEQYWIEQFKCWGFHLLNITKGGEGFGHKHSEETKRKMSLSQKGLQKNFTQKTIEERRKFMQSDANPMKNPLFKQKVINARKGNNSWVTETMKEMARKRIQKSVKNNTQSGNKSILQYDLSGNFIKEWISIKQVKNDLGFCERVLINVCKGRKISACGFVWRYKTPNYQSKIDIPKKSINQLLIQYDKKMNMINEFESLVLAYKTTNISKTAIANNLSGLSKSAGGFIWKYKQLNN